MELILALIVVILVGLISYNRVTVEKYTNNTFSHLVESKSNFEDIKNKELDSNPAPKFQVQELIPEYMPEEINEHLYMGRLSKDDLLPQDDMYLYGKPLEAVHKLYSHIVVKVVNKKIVSKIFLSPREKVTLKSPLFIRNESQYIGPYILN